MFKIIAAIIIAGFILLRPYFLQSNGMMYGYGVGDDYGYFAQASSLVFGQFPSYSKECFIDGKIPAHVIGAGILAAPFVFVFSFLDRLEGSHIFEQRTALNINGSWSQFGFFFASVFYFCLACLLLYEAVSLYVKPSYALWAIIAMVICQGMPLFVYRRPIFSHSFEFFLQSFFVFLFLKNEFHKGQLIKHWWTFVVLGAAASLIFLTRYNNLIFALAWPLFFIGRDWQNRTIKVIASQCFLIAVPFLIFVAYFKWWPEVYNSFSPYPSIPWLISAQVTAGEVLKRIVHVFIGLDWGLFFTAPFALLAFVGLILWKSPLKKRYALILLPLVVNFYIIIFFGSQGGWYGYRYFIASAFPLLVLPLAVFFDWSNLRLGIISKVFLSLIALMPIVSMISFECNESVNLNLILLDFGRTDWSNPLYQVFAWDTVLNIQTHWMDLLQGGALYFYYLCTKIGQWFQLLNKESIIYISYIDIKVFVKTVFIYLAPLIVWCLFRHRGVLVRDSSK